MPCNACLGENVIGKKWSEGCVFLQRSTEKKKKKESNKNLLGFRNIQKSFLAANADNFCFQTKLWGGASRKD